jgi:N-carbamoyl-L-amino-acid hydrolase
LATVAKFGGRSDGGVARLALDDNDTRARLWLIEQASVVGAIASVDAIGNVFLDVPGSEPELEPTVTGSHLDSQPAGGKYDGALGVVEGIQGVSWFEVTVTGSANHAGTTPRALRRDALEGACALATALRDATRDDEDRVRFTIGTFSVSPGSVNTIPDHVTFSIDLRHPEAATLKALEATFNQLSQQTWAGCRAALTPLSRVEPVDFPATLTVLLDDTAHELGITAPRLVSGAFHDAIHLAQHCPTAMLFVPCRNGLSHHPDEHTEIDDAVVGTQLLAASLASLTR